MKTLTCLTLIGLSCAPAYAHLLVQARHPVAAEPVAEPVAAAPVAAPLQAAAFASFAPAVKTRWDGQFLYVEGHGMPAHNMMVGITAWQQQVPIPQDYSGANAWRIPLHPVAAAAPRKLENQFLRGAVALAVNGIPIFNPQNNRGEFAAEIGELDEWGGHCGRADDYHYHLAPLHLEATAGKGKPIAFALDGYPILGLTEPDGSPLRALDACHGHADPRDGYHYHASTQRPYLQSAFHGEVSEIDGQVDPQPRAQPLRQGQPPLREAKITSFSSSADGKQYQLVYSRGAGQGSVKYADLGNNRWKFQFVDQEGATTETTYQGGQTRPDGQRPPKDPGQRTPRPEAPARGRPGQPGEPAQVPGSQAEMDALKKPLLGFVLSSPAIAADGKLAAQFTGDGEGVTPPLHWTGAPAGTQSFVLVMDHLAPGNVIKTYWTLWDIPATTTDLPTNVHAVGTSGRSFNGRQGYEPPHSQGPGLKTYVITLYALRASPQLAHAPGAVTREELLNACNGQIIASASLSVNYTRNGDPAAPGDSPRPTRREAQESRPAGPQPATDPPSSPQAPQGLIKPSMADTVHAEVYADNWFMLYINDRLVAVDPIEFTPHNVVSFDFLPDYPLNIAVLVKDNADPKTGLEYGTHIGDGGFILKFADGTVTHANWKAKSFFHGPLNRNTANPQVRIDPLPERWWAGNFDDHAWPNAKEFTTAQVDPKPPFFDHDFTTARFIWTDDLALDNTVVFRTKIDKPGWTPRWNTKPDLKVNGQNPAPAAP
jgi:phosphatidylethanolamine-binding protein (PEBP) family uncharacterized protein